MVEESGMKVRVYQQTRNLIFYVIIQHTEAAAHRFAVFRIAICTISLEPLFNQYHQVLGVNDPPIQLRGIVLGI